MSESQLIEYKESWRSWLFPNFKRSGYKYPIMLGEFCKAKLVKQDAKRIAMICGFANAQGGVLYIGKRDDGSVCGVADSKKLMEDIPNKVRDALGLIVDVDLITENGLDVIKITVEENPYPVNYKGEYHYRTGSTKQLLQGSALTNFLLRKTGKNWDSVPLENVSVEDLDKESFDIFHREAIRSGRMSKDDLKLSNQDFSVGVPVQISVYKDKLYISNDCVFPANWTADTLMQKHRSLPHNPDIANTFFRAGFIESWGRGIEKICNLCKEYGILEPEYTVHPNDIMMMFKANVTEKIQNTEDNNAAKSGLKNIKWPEKAEQIINAVSEDNRITITKLEEILDIGHTTVKKILSEMQSEGYIRRVGADKGGHWEII